MESNRILLAYTCSVVSVLINIHVVTGVSAAQKQVLNKSLASVSSAITTAHKENISGLDSVEFSISLEYTYSPLTVLMRSENGMQEYSVMSLEQKEALKKKGYVKALHNYRIVMQAGNIRYETTGQSPSGIGGEMVAFDKLSTNNVSGSKSLSLDVSGQHGFDHGSVYSHNMNEVTMEIAMLPILLSFYGPGNPNSGIPDLGSLDLASGEFDSGDIQLNALYDKGQNGWTETYTFRAKSNFCLTHISRARVSGEPMSEFSIAYSKESESAKVLPDSWEYISFFPDGDVRYSITANVTSFALNPKTDDSTFDIQFPVGTMVSDGRPGQPGYDRRFGDHLYIVLSDGSKRTITSPERRLEYQEILSRPAPTIKINKNSYFAWAIVALNVAVVILIVVYYGVRKKKISS